MKTKQILIRLSPENLKSINDAWKQALIQSEEPISRSEFIRKLLNEAIKNYNRKNK